MLALARLSTPASARCERSQSGGGVPALVGNGGVRGQAIRSSGWAAGAAGSADLHADRARMLKCLTAAAALKEEVPPPPRHGESNPDP